MHYLSSISLFLFSHGENKNGARKKTPLTAPHAPEPSGNRLVLHQDEGNTSREPHSSGSIDILDSAKGHRSSVPIWPIPLMLAVVLFLIERAMAVYSHEEDR